MSVVAAAALAAMNLLLLLLTRELTRRDLGHVLAVFGKRHRGA
jgi:hypothetical protein